jgi:predicted Fe-Mo cluster-binding NifX family protein
MIIAIAANENHLKGVVDPHFGRCDWFCMYNTDTKKHSFVENPVRHNQDMAGCDAATFLLEKQISMAIAGRFGSKVVDVFTNNNIQMVIPESQVITLEEIIKQIK